MALVTYGRNVSIATSSLPLLFAMPSPPFLLRQPRKYVGYSPPGAARTVPRHESEAGASDLRVDFRGLPVRVVRLGAGGSRGEAAQGRLPGVALPALRRLTPSSI